MSEWERPIEALSSKGVKELRRLQAENAKLREENERLKLFANGDAIITDYWKDEDGTMHVLTTDGRSTYEYMRGGLAEENAKLRELVRDMWEGYNDPRCEECHLKDMPICADCPICAREALVIDRMQELGVEV